MSQKIRKGFKILKNFKNPRKKPKAEMLSAKNLSIVSFIQAVSFHSVKKTTSRENRSAVYGRGVVKHSFIFSFRYELRFFRRKSRIKLNGFHHMRCGIHDQNFLIRLRRFKAVCKPRSENHQIIFSHLSTKFEISRFVIAENHGRTLKNRTNHFTSVNFSVRLDRKFITSVFSDKKRTVRV